MQTRSFPMPFSLDDLHLLQQTLLWTPQDDHNLQELGNILEPYLETIACTWYSSYIASLPHLARDFAVPEETPDSPDPLSGDKTTTHRRIHRFQEWIRSLCFQPKDTNWLKEQWNIALKHRFPANSEENSSPVFVHMRYMITFVYPVMKIVQDVVTKRIADPIRRSQLMDSWLKALILTSVLWTAPYTSRELW